MRAFRYYDFLVAGMVAAVMLFNFLFKVGVEVVFTPVTYFVVGRLKRVEGVDTYDRHTHFTPFSLQDEGERAAP